MAVSEGRAEGVRSTVINRVGLSDQTPCHLFRRIQKRDGTIVDFCPQKITDAIFKAAQSVGGKDRKRSETLTEYVILDLARRHQDSTNLLNIEQVQDSIERVLVDNGHYRTAKAFITYRSERAKRRALRREPLLTGYENGANETLHDTSVWTSSGEYIRWDREKIVKALVRETGLPYQDARQVSYQVEMEIIHSKITHLTAPLIRELTNSILLQMGYEKERRAHARLGLPLFDVQERLLGRKSEHGSTSVEAEIIRQFAVDRILPLKAAQAHANREIHVEDLDLVHRPLMLVRELDPVGSPFLPFPLKQEESDPGSGWEVFMSTWRREETRLLEVVGKRLAWVNVNAAIALQVHNEGIPIQTACRRALASLGNLSETNSSQPQVVWKLTDRLPVSWRARFLGARQLSLLPGDELDQICRAVLLEILRQVEEGGACWTASGIRFEVTLDASSNTSSDPVLMQALAGCLVNQAPVDVHFRRRTVVSDSRQTENHHLFQVISLNFLRAAALAGGKDSLLAEWLEDRLQLICEAHQSKREFLAKRLAQGALKPLVRPEDKRPGYYPLGLEDGIWGIGVAGLDAMTYLHTGKHPAEDEGAQRWLLNLMARLRLRLDDLSSRSGLNLQFVTSTQTGIAERFSEGLPLSSELLGWTHEENLLIRETGQGYAVDDWLNQALLEGKLHPFFACGQATLAVNMGSPANREVWAERLQQAAEKTHLGGLMRVGQTTLCLNCGGQREQQDLVCPDCGHEQRLVIEHHRHGTTIHLTTDR